MRQNPLVKRNKKGEEKTYYRWVCSWREGDKTITKYLGSVNKMNEAEALEKARRLKADYINASRISPDTHPARQPLNDMSSHRESDVD